jgi:hypothetical protein
MNKRNRFVGASALIFGLMSLLSALSKPSLHCLRGFEVVRLIASGACLAIAFVGLFGRLKTSE